MKTPDNRLCTLQTQKETISKFIVEYLTWPSNKFDKICSAIVNNFIIHYLYLISILGQRVWWKVCFVIGEKIWTVANLATMLSLYLYR